jgi:hypothetical protein
LNTIGTIVTDAGARLEPQNGGDAEKVQNSPNGPEADHSIESVNKPDAEKLGDSLEGGLQLPDD